MGERICPKCFAMMPALKSDIELLFMPAHVPNTNDT